MDVNEWQERQVGTWAGICTTPVVGATPAAIAPAPAPAPALAVAATATAAGVLCALLLHPLFIIIIDYLFIFSNIYIYLHYFNKKKLWDSFDTM